MSDQISDILNKVTAHLGMVHPVVQETRRLYAEVKQRGFKVPNDISLLAACVYYAARRERGDVLIAVGEITRVLREMGHSVTPRLVLLSGRACRRIAHICVAAPRPEVYLERLLPQVAGYPGLGSRVQRKTGIPLARYMLELTAVTRQLAGGFPPGQRGGLHPYNLAASLIYAADRILAKRRGTPSALSQEIVAEVSGLGVYSIRDIYCNMLKSKFLVSRRSKKSVRSMAYEEGDSSKVHEKCCEETKL